MLATTHDLFTSRYIKKIPKITLKGVENSLSLIAENNPKAKGRKAEEFMDPSFMDELEATGFIKSDADGRIKCNHKPVNRFAESQ